MTLLTIANDAADEVDLGTDFTTIVGNSDPGATKLLRYANKVGRRLMKSHAWQALRKEKTFTGVSGSEQTSILPADFDRFVPETMWDRGNNRLISGPVQAQRWQGMKAQGYAGFPQYFIYRGGSVFVIPSMGGGESIAYEYVSKNWCQSPLAAAQSAWADDQDTGLLDEELITLGVIYEYLKGEQLPTYQDAAMAYVDYYNTLTGNDQPSAGVLVAGDLWGGGRHFDGQPPSSSYDISIL